MKILFVWGFIETFYGEWKLRSVFSGTDGNLLKLFRTMVDLHPIFIPATSIHSYHRNTCSEICPDNLKSFFVNADTLSILSNT